MSLLAFTVALVLSGPVPGAGLATAVVPARPHDVAQVVAPGAVSSPSGRAPVSRAPWSAPVAPLRVARAFDAPAQNWLPGHRGVDLRAAAGTQVLSPDDGRVVFAGRVAGRPVLSVEHVDPADPGGTVRSTYEPVIATVRQGEVVKRGTVIGSVADASHCEGGCLHWGARRSEVYVDPLSFLHRRIRLLTPVGGSGVPDQAPPTHEEKS